MCGKDIKHLKHLIKHNIISCRKWLHKVVGKRGKKRLVRVRVEEGQELNGRRGRNLNIFPSWTVCTCSYKFLLLIVLYYHFTHSNAIASSRDPPSGILWKKMIRKMLSMLSNLEISFRTIFPIMIYIDFTGKQRLFFNTYSLKGILCNLTLLWQRIIYP